jgi:hypothetical protein
MKQILSNQARRAGIALAVVAAFAAFGIGTAQAATFVSASITVEPRGEAAGGLTCSWRETGLGASQVVYYTCTAGVVGALKACVYKNRVIFNSPTKLDIFKNVTGEHGAAVPFLSQKNGQINASTTTPIPEIEVPEGAQLCTAPSEETTVSVRWCNASLTDTTNSVVGATVGELFQDFVSAAGSVPSCADLLASP